jgi:deoxycytidine triphosphate deaminase
MFLGKAEILRRIAEEGLLENLKIENVQGAGVDLEIDLLYQPISGASLRRRARSLPELREVRGDTYVLAPGKYYLCTTHEKVNMPRDLVAFIFQRSTLFRCGVSLRTAVVDPGYTGTLTIGIINEGPEDFVLERGARICQIVFSAIQGDAAGYKGRYQGGMVR